jgi:hypothetical protein
MQLLVIDAFVTVINTAALRSMTNGFRLSALTGGFSSRAAIYVIKAPPAR